MNGPTGASPLYSNKYRIGILMNRLAGEKRLRTKKADFEL